MYGFIQYFLKIRKEKFKKIDMNIFRGSIKRNY